MVKQFALSVTVNPHDEGITGNIVLAGGGPKKGVVARDGKVSLISQRVSRRNLGTTILPLGEVDLMRNKFRLHCGTASL